MKKDQLRYNRIMCFFLFFSIVFSFVVVYSPVVKAGSSYYVSTTGSDTTGDGSIGNPWRTIDHVVNNHLSAGDILYIRGGTYNEHSHMYDIDGTSANWITIINYPGETPIIDGDSPSVITGVGLSHGLFMVEDSEYILVDGLYVRDCHSGSNLVVKNCSNVTVQNCHTYGTPYSGIRFTNSNDAQDGTYSYDVKCLNCLVQLARHDYGGGTSNEALDIVACNRFEVAYCEVDETNVNLGLTIKTASCNGIVHHNNLYSCRPGFYMGNYATFQGRHQRNITIYNNWIHGDGSGGNTAVCGIGGETPNNYMENITFYNNIFDASSGVAEEAFVSVNPGSGILHVSNISFFNNIFISVRGGKGAMRLSAPGSADPFWWENVVISNNIFKYVGGEGIRLSGLQDNHPEEMTIDNNLFYTGTEEDNMDPDWDVNSIIDNPDWISSSDFHLQSTSPCINAANSSTAPSFDYDDIARPIGGGDDIGPYEYYNETSEPNPPEDLTITSVNTTSIHLTWTKGSNAYKTRIMRKSLGFPTSITDGTLVCNSTGDFQTVTSLTPGEKYYFRAWSYNGSCDTIYSSTYDDVYTGTYPEPPTSGVLVLDSIPSFHVNLSWTKGTGAGYTYIRMKTGSYPTSYSDGTLIYSGDGSTCEYNITEGEAVYFKAWSYMAWDVGWYKYSLTGLEFSTDLGMYINCFDEVTNANLTFDVFISNATGEDVYLNTNCTNTFIINTSYLPSGEDCQIMISAAGYESRVFYVDIESGLVLNLNAYLPNDSSGTYLYNLRVVESLSSESGFVDFPVEDVTIIIKRYEENIGVFTNISVLKTDDYGYVNLYLIAGSSYKVFLSKSGYISSSSDYIPEPGNEWGQTVEKIFRIIQMDEDIEPSIDDLLENVMITKFNLTHFRIYYNNPEMDTVQVGFIIYYGDTAIFDNTVTSSPNEVLLYFDHTVLELSLDVILRLVVTSNKEDNSSNIIIKYFSINQLSSSDNSSSAPVMAIISVIMCFFGLTLVSPKHTFGAVGIIVIIISLAFTAFSYQTWYIHLIQAIELILLMFVFLVFKEEGTTVI